MQHRHAVTRATTARLWATAASLWGDPSSGEDPYRYRLLLRFVAINALGIAVLAAALIEGWLGTLLAGDTTGLVRVIILTFLLGFAWCTSEVVQVSAELNASALRRPPPDGTVGRYLGRLRAAAPDARSSVEAAMQQRLAGRLVPIRHLAATLVLLGLIGTVVGFVIALSGVDPSTAGHVEQVAPMIATLIEGLGVALYTTLVGAALNIWLMLGYRVLEAGMARLHIGLLERGARHDRL